MPAQYHRTTSTVGGDAAIWPVWVNSTYTSTATTTCDQIWTGWVSNRTTATSDGIYYCTQDRVWTAWSSSQEDAVQAPHVRRVETAEEIEARDRSEREWQARQAVLQRELEDSHSRAEKLLLENLSLQQQMDYRKNGHFVVHGHAGRRFRIRKGRVGNVDVIDKNGVIIDRLCAHPNQPVPDPDTMLAQKLHLELDDVSFMRVANKHGILIPNQRVLQPMH